MGVANSKEVLKQFSEGVGDDAPRPGRTSTATHVLTVIVFKEVHKRQLQMLKYLLQVKQVLYSVRRVCLLTLCPSNLASDQKGTYMTLACGMRDLHDSLNDTLPNLKAFV